MSEPDVDVLRVFLDKLSPVARRAYDHHDVATITAIRAACERITVTELARICSAGVERYNAANGRGLIIYRLRREAGQLDDAHNETPRKAR